MSKEIRWKQRFVNFDKAFNQLKSAIDIGIDSLSDLEKEGLIQRFEYTFELAWKTLKDLLESKGIEAKFPRDVIKHAFSAEIISDGEVWMDMLDKRNLMAHSYSETNFKESMDAIFNDYFSLIEDLHKKLQDLK